MSSGISKETDLTDSCKKCGDEYVAPGHECEPAEPNKASEKTLPGFKDIIGLFADASEVEMSEQKRYADTEICALVSAYDGDISDLEAAKLIIDDQAEQLKAKDKEIQTFRTLAADAGLVLQDLVKHWPDTEFTREQVVKRLEQIKKALII